MIKFYFLKGIIHRHNQSTETASSYFKRLFETPVSTEKDIVYRAKTLHILGEILYENGKITKAIEHLKLSQSELTDNRLPVRPDTYYNLAILSLHLGNISESVKYLSIYRKHENRDDAKPAYLRALLQIFHGHIRDGLKSISELRPKILETHDVDTFLRSSLASLYFTDWSNEAFEKHLELTNRFMKYQLLDAEITEPQTQEHLAELVNSVIGISLKHERYFLVENHIEIAYRYHQKYPSLQCRYKVYFLHALYLKKMNKDKQKQKELLLEAKRLLQLRKGRNIHYFCVLYELAQFETVKEPLFNELLDVLGNHITLESMDFFHIEAVIPRFLPESI
ncbi:hypothetical protein [Pueribacillus sp. YX66]|uniref:hypothetical protein n=1 Tax=Pueribacillus sp. YX66 TaxID=3229242 RepID=UPI00358CE48A